MVIHGKIISHSPGYKVTLRGQMHIRHLRELATKISNLRCENVDLMKCFSFKIQTLCKAVFSDCCIELEDTAEGVEKAASSTNHLGYLENRQAITKDVAQKCQKLCSSSEKSSGRNFLAVVPCLIGSIKEIFVDERISEVQNGLRGLSERTLEQFLSSVRNAEQRNSIQQLVCKVCEILELLCLENSGNHPTTDILKWGETLAIPSMLDFLSPFFQHCQYDMRLLARLALFSRRLKDIMSHQVDIADKVFMHDFCNVSLSLIHFAKFSPSKLIRFNLTDSKHSSVACDRDNNTVRYERHQETFYQCFEIRKESDDELQLHATVDVHVDGRISTKGAFQSVFMLSPPGEEALDKCMSRFTDVAAIKLNDKDSENLQVILCSTQKEKLSEVLDVLKRELAEEVADVTRSKVTQCHLTIRTVGSKVGSVVSLRLVYKWGSEAIGLDSKDFVTFADSSAGGAGACIPELQLIGKMEFLTIDLGFGHCNAVFNFLLFCLCGR